MSKTLAWSWTRLDCFEQCPRKFQGTYVIKDFAKPDFDAPHFAKGKAVHKVLENYLKDGTPIPYPIPYKGNHFFVRLDFLLPMLNKLREAKIVEVEMNVCFDVRMNKVTWYSKKAWCRIIFDVLVIVGDFALVIDWKSGKVKKFSDQLKLFAGGVFTMYPQVNRVLSAYVWCEHEDQAPVWAEYEREEDMEAIWQEFGDRSEMIQLANESGNWPATKNRFCNWCDALPSQCEFKND